MPFASWPIPFTRKRILCLLLVGIIVEAVYLPYALRAYLVRTDYAPGFDKDAFFQIKPGDVVTTVFLKLGSPLSFRVVDEVGRVQACSSNLSALSYWQTNNSVVIHLQYSKSKSFKGNYRVREVLIRGGVVKETRAFIYWD
jgi:hypothetical protein